MLNLKLILLFIYNLKQGNKKSFVSLELFLRFGAFWQFTSYGEEDEVGALRYK